MSQKLPNMLDNTIAKIREMLDANSVVGQPITTEGVTIIPISKIFVGLATGGIDYFGKKAPTSKNFGGGGGTGMSVVPVGFLVVDNRGDVEFINVGMKGKPDPVDQIADLVDSDIFKPLFLQ